MTFTPRSDDEQQRAITRLVDGTLSDVERPAVESWAAGRPEVEREVARQHRVATELRTGGPSPPEPLIEVVEDRLREAQRQRARRRKPSIFGLRTGWRPAFVAVTLTAVAAVVVSLSIGFDTRASRPSIPAAAQLAHAPSTGPAPAVKSAKLLDVAYAGITYPNYGRFAVVPAGQRVDRLGGRPALTVFYRTSDGVRLSYTVFSGNPVPLPRTAHQVRFDGVPLYLVKTGTGLSVVTLVRNGRTCVLAAVTGPARVLALAAVPVRAQAT